MSWRLKALMKGLEAYKADGLSDVEKMLLCLRVRKAVAVEDFQIKADDAVATALWAFCSRWEVNGNP
eukprot:scaffold558562_cov32-Prasinocladus_malaysianus.AAC.1